MITILTPTYNRAYTLPVLYESLKCQSSKHFEWIIIDDGSIDDTKRLVYSWIEENIEFDIKYIYKSNGGKHTAINIGVPLSNYSYIYIVDSDDYLLCNAVELIHKWIETIDNDKKFAGVSGLRASKNMEIIGGFLSNKVYVDATNLDRNRMNLYGDKAEVYRKEILLNYPFPEFSNERFITEAVVWDKIAHNGYKLRWYSQVICICEYLNDGLTLNSNDKYKIDNFLGYTEYEKQNYEYGNIVEKALVLSRYYDISKDKKLTIRKISKNLSSNLSFLILVIIIREIFRFCMRGFKK